MRVDIYISFADFSLLCETEHTKMALFSLKMKKNVLTNSIDNYILLSLDRFALTPPPPPLPPPLSATINLSRKLVVQLNIHQLKSVHFS